MVLFLRPKKFFADEVIGNNVGSVWSLNDPLVKTSGVSVGSPWRQENRKT